MIGTSLPEYILIRVSIFALQFVAPASAAYLAFCVGYPNVFPWIIPIAAAEVLFFIGVYLPRKAHLAKISNDVPKQLSREERGMLFERCRQQFLHESYPLGWFIRSEGRIGRENMRQWLLWALFGAREAVEAWEEELEYYITTIEGMIGPLDKGYRESSQSMRISYDDLEMRHRPLMFYLVVGLVDFITSMKLMYIGFQHYAPFRWFSIFPSRPLTILSRTSATQHFPYWYRPHRSTTKDPVVFIHGIGIGLYPYVDLFKDIDPEIGILAIELLPISMHMTSEPLPYRTVMLEAISDTLKSLCIKHFVLLTHSYGTTIGAHILRSDSPLSDAVSSYIFIDPIPILLHLPDVAFNFLYRAPKRANEWQLWYFASVDPDIARTLWRHFWWQECVLWRDDLIKLGKNVAVVLSGEDQIVRARDVWRYVTQEEDVPLEQKRWENGEGVEVLYYPGLDHATSFDTKERRTGLVEVIERLTEKASERSEL